MKDPQKKAQDLYEWLPNLVQLDSEELNWNAVTFQFVWIKCSSLIGGAWLRLINWWKLSLNWLLTISLTNCKLLECRFALLMWKQSNLKMKLREETGEQIKLIIQIVDKIILRHIQRHKIFIYYYSMSHSKICFNKSTENVSWFDWHFCSSHIFCIVWKESDNVSCITIFPNRLKL